MIRTLSRAQTLACLLLIASCSGGGPAFAQTVAQASVPVVTPAPGGWSEMFLLWKPAIDALVLLIGTCISIVGSYLIIPKLTTFVASKAEKAGFEVDQKKKEAWDRAMGLAFGAAVSRVTAVTSDMLRTGAVPPHLQQDLTREMADFIAERFRETALTMGTDPSTAAGVKAIEAASEARIGMAAITAATSPVSAASAISPDAAAKPA